MKIKESVVSVILPIYNADKYLFECLESLQSQTYEHLQIIAIDDKSKDDSVKILKKFKRTFKDIEIYTNKKHYGMAVCYNRALRAAKGQFIAFMNPHDLSAPNRFKRQVNFLTKNPKVAAVGTQYTSIDDNKKKLERSNLPHEHADIYDTMIQAGTLKPETVMINRMRLPKDLLYFNNNKYPLAFTEIFVKIFQYGKVANIAHSLYFYRDGIKRYSKRNYSKMNQISSMMKLWFKSRNEYDYRPPIRSFFTPLLKETL